MSKPIARSVGNLLQIAAVGVKGGLFSYISPEARVPPNHPLRKIRALVRDVLGELNRSRLYSSEGRPSIAPEQLLSALLLRCSTAFARSAN
jgi:transposase